MSEEKFLMFRNRLGKIFRHFSKQATRLKISCYRIYDHDIPEFPFCIEFYEDNLYVAEYKRHYGMSEEQHEGWLKLCLDIISDILKVPLVKIYLKIRQRKRGRLGQYQKLAERKHEFIIQENNLKFIVNLTDYLDTGLFLDHRVTRQMVREQAAGKNVLNLFCYTGSFSVYAADGGANTILSVDLSKTYLDWANRNMRLNHFTDRSRYKSIQGDVKSYLKTISPEAFDLIIMDPPTFSNSKRMKDFLEIQRDHSILINDGLKAITPDGILFFSCNLKNFVLEKEKINSGNIIDITKKTIPFDFQRKLFRYCFLIKKSF